MDFSFHSAEVLCDVCVCYSQGISDATPRAVWMARPGRRDGNIMNSCCVLLPVFYEHLLVAIHSNSGANIRFRFIGAVCYSAVNDCGRPAQLYIMQINSVWFFFSNFLCQARVWYLDFYSFRLLGIVGKLLVSRPNDNNFYSKAIKCVALGVSPDKEIGFTDASSSHTHRTHTQQAHDFFRARFPGLYRVCIRKLSFTPCAYHNDWRETCAWLLLQFTSYRVWLVDVRAYDNISATPIGCTTIEIISTDCAEDDRWIISSASVRGTEFK